MQVIQAGKGSGKTAQLIKKSLDENVPICTLLKSQANRIVETSFELYGKACRVVSLEDIEKRKYAGPIFFDDADDLIKEYIFNLNPQVSVKCVTLTAEN